MDNSHCLGLHLRKGSKNAQINKPSVIGHLICFVWISLSAIEKALSNCCLVVVIAIIGVVIDRNVLYSAM